MEKTKKNIWINVMLWLWAYGVPPCTCLNIFICSFAFCTMLGGKPLSYFRIAYWIERYTYYWMGILEFVVKNIDVVHHTCIGYARTYIFGVHQLSMNKPMNLYIHFYWSLCLFFFDHVKIKFHPSSSHSLLL
jgi:hypothetical protein